MRHLGCAGDRIARADEVLLHVVEHFGNGRRDCGQVRRALNFADREFSHENIVLLHSFEFPLDVCDVFLYIFSIRQDTAGYGRIWQDTSGYVRIRQP